MTFYVETNEADGRKPVFEYILKPEELRDYWFSIPNREYGYWGFKKDSPTVQWMLREAKQQERELCQSLGQKWQSFRARWVSKKLKQLCKPELG